MKTGPWTAHRPIKTSLYQSGPVKGIFGPVLDQSRSRLSPIWVKKPDWTGLLNTSHRLLVERGANAAGQDQHGSTWPIWRPLMAILTSHSSLSSMAPTWQARMWVDSAHLASFDGHIDITQFLVERGANVAGQDQHGSILTHLASFDGHLNIAQFLVECGADMAGQDQHRLTPPHLAFFDGHLNIAWFLIKHGTNVAGQDQCGTPPPCSVCHVPFQTQI